jgi:Zn-dependent protease with chaperone function
MSTPAPRPRLDERALAAGTTMRFAMLLILLLVASGSLMLPIVTGLRDSDRLGCELAAGVDPGDDTVMTASSSMLSQGIAFAACIARYAPPPPWWQVAAWPVLVSVSAAALFFALPALKARRRRVVPLDSLDGDGEIRGLLAELAATAGLAQLPRVIVDRAAVSTGAVVFGRSRRPTVCLHGGLLACRRSDPERFRAVLLHELAHVSNRDVTVTYATVTLWRVFLLVVLAPYLVWLGVQSYGRVLSWSWSGDLAIVTRGLLLPLFMVALVYLARSDVLRSREVYADLAAVRWGADPHGWTFTTPVPAGGAVLRARARLLELWHTHPPWETRRHAMTDPAPLFEVRALPTFLTGAAAALVNTQLLFYVSTYNLGTRGIYQAAALAPALLITGVAGTALWRTVAYAVLTSGRVPSGARTGLWLGAGMAVGELLTGYGFGSGWLPSRPRFLLLVVLVGVAFACWVAKCSHLWARTWRGRTLRPALLLGLLAAFLALSSWFAWWKVEGLAYADGFSYSTAGVRQMALRLIPGSAAPHHAELSVIVALLPVLQGLLGSPLLPAAITALWVVPLVAWTIGPAPGVPRWVVNARHDADEPPPDSGEPLPPLRRVLLPGLLGGFLAWLGIAAVQVYLHTARSEHAHALSYVAAMFVVLAAAALVAAITANAMLGHHRLLGTLIATETAALLGLAGMFLLVSADGCAGPLNTLQTTCAWRPAWQATRSLFGILLNDTLVLGTVIAALVATAGSAGRAVRRSRPPARPPQEGQSVPGGRRLGAVLLCVAAAVIGTTDTAYLVRKTVWTPDLASAQRATQQFSGLATATVSADTRADQVHAWYRLGGRYLLDHAAADSNQLQTTLRTAVNTRNVFLTYQGRFRSTCADLGRVAAWENGYYFRVPDPSAEAAWHEFGSLARQGSQDCERGLKLRNGDLFLNAMRELIAAGNDAASVTTRVQKLMRDAGYKGSSLRP